MSDEHKFCIMKSECNPEQGQRDNTMKIEISQTIINIIIKHSDIH